LCPMTISATDSLKFAASKEEDSSSSSINDKNHEMENLSYKALEVIRKNLVVGISTRADAIDELMKSGLVSSDDLIRANEWLRWLEDDHEIFPVEHSGLIMFTLQRNISSFDRHQRQLQEEWLLLLTKEFGPSCAIEEAREIAALEIVGKKEQGVLH
jgi:hypothetical protein